MPASSAAAGEAGSLRITSGGVVCAVPGRCGLTPADAATESALSERAFRGRCTSLPTAHQSSRLFTTPHSAPIFTTPDAAAEAWPGQAGLGPAHLHYSADHDPAARDRPCRWHSRQWQMRGAQGSTDKMTTWWSA